MEIYAICKIYTIKEMQSVCLRVIISMLHLRVITSYSITKNSESAAFA